MATTDDDLIALQISPEAPLVNGAQTATSMLVAPSRTVDRLRHFPEEIYDLRAESHLVRFIKVLLGDAGANQVRKAALLARLRATLQGSHFFDLDRFYGPLFGIRRAPGEKLDFDPQSSTASTADWDDAISADASFRSRIEQLAKALTYGATPTGMELIAEAVLSVDCDIYESYIQADASYRTVDEIEDLYGDGTPGGFVSDMEGVPISTLEGEELARISGDERRVFTVVPRREITQQEAFDLRRVLNRVRPADCRFVIDFNGAPSYEDVEIHGAAADSEHWEIISEVVPETVLNSPYPVSDADNPVEQPRPPFSGYQGEAWSYNADIIGANASTDDDGTISVLPPQRVTYADGSFKDFSADQCVLPRRMVNTGRAVSDGVLVVHPYPGLAQSPVIFEDFHTVDPNYGLPPLYVDGMPLEELVDLLQREDYVADPFQQNPENRYWVSDSRYLWDDVKDVIEIRLAAARRINYLTFEISHYPHRAQVEMFTEDNDWVEVYTHEIPDSFPKVISHDIDFTRRQGHPEHASGAHWVRVGTRVDPVVASRIRISMHRNVQTASVDPPVRMARDEMGGRKAVRTPYTLAVRSVDLGYRISSRDDFDADGDGESDAIIASTRDMNGSAVQFRPHELRASNLLGDGYWRSEPQPVNYAVVSAFLDTRTESGDGSVVDRFYLDPTHVGCHLTLYYSNDPQVPDGTNEFYEGLRWTPIPRDYVLHKGFLHLPATRARYWKFEFTNLAIEPYEALIPIHRKVRLFPRSVVEAMNRNYERTATEVPNEMLPALDAVTENFYNDALNALGIGTVPYSRTPDSASYKATEALYFPSLAQAAKARDASWVFGFMPWQQPDRAPRFSVTGIHSYEVADVLHTAKVAFFVGLREIRAYRARWEQDVDTQVYYDTLDDFRNLTPGFTWQFEPGYMTTGATPLDTPAEASSRVFSSRNNVVAVQFATVQSPPVQLVPDHNFRDPALAAYGWDDPDYWTKIGDAQLIYSEADHSVINVRRVVPLGMTVSSPTGTVRDIVQPVFSYTDFEVPDPGSTEDAIGGLSTPPIGLSAEGRVYAAVRFVALRTLTSPLLLRIVDNADGTVLAEKALTAQRNQTIEDWVHYDIADPEMSVHAQLVQVDKSDDTWKVHDLALFEDSIIWEFSNNGGADWFPAQVVRNNDRGVLTFPDAGNALRYRARAQRTNQWVSAIKIRPWYVGLKNARTNGTHRGPNVSVYDSDVPIQDDPMFTAWRKPIPAWWFERRQSFPILPVDGAPNVTEFARFYGRPTGDSVDSPTDEASAVVIHSRSAEERLDYFDPTTDDVVRSVSTSRSLADAAVVSDTAIGTPVHGISKPIVSGIVMPVYSEKEDGP